MTEANVCFAFRTGAKKPFHIFSDLESVKLKRGTMWQKIANRVELLDYSGSIGNFAAIV